MEDNLFTEEDMENLIGGKKVNVDIRPSDVEEIKRDIIKSVGKRLGFLRDWHLCPKCSAVFGLREGEEGTCPICECVFYNEGGDIIFRGFPEEEEEEEESGEEGEEEEAEEKKDKGTETVIIRGGSLMTPDNSEVEVEKIGVADCPFCEKSIDWDSVDIHYGFFGEVKKCPECREQIYALGKDEMIWLRRNLERDNEVGFFGGVCFGGFGDDEEED